eukprot:TRINITY_DN17251_c0_g1_i3.p1 TRINITY_DN17251_c0_g1~~TRINITY_DN17251_c0_g1_i3.p1  ORF type:complete len:253 (-),score=-1.10 TRINITY_DN17251_c0_g1_i3:16-750(-)
MGVHKPKKSATFPDDDSLNQSHHDPQPWVIVIVTNLICFLWMSSNTSDYIFKVILLGDSSVGKSSLLSRFTRNEFLLESKTTIGVEFGTHSLLIDGQTIKVQLWDCCGAERFRAVTAGYYRGAKGAVIVFDLSNRLTFENVEKWLSELEQYAPDTVVVLVGNKKDLKFARQVSAEEAKSFAEDHGIFYLETSALVGSGVQQTFMSIILDVLARSRSHWEVAAPSTVVISSENHTRSHRCCFSLP